MKIYVRNFYSKVTDMLLFKDMLIAMLAVLLIVTNDLLAINGKLQLMVTVTIWFVIITGILYSIDSRQINSLTRALSCNISAQIRAEKKEVIEKKAV